MEELGNYRLVCPTSVPGKITEQTLLKVKLRHMRDEKVIQDSQHGFRSFRYDLRMAVSFYNGEICQWTKER